MFLRLNKNRINVFKTWNNTVLTDISKSTVLIDSINLLPLNRIITSLYYKWSNSSVNNARYKIKN